MAAADDPSTKFLEAEDPEDLFEFPLIRNRMPWGNYLKDEELRGFRKYKYSAVDTSPLSNYVMHPFWNWLVPWVPRCIAPNTLTLSGFLLIVVNLVIFSYYDWDFHSAANSTTFIPSWIWIVIAFNHFWAHTLDGLDGKHARRTNSSSPLGELFDHGLDSWVTTLQVLCIFSVFGVDNQFGISTFRMYAVLWVMLILFSLSHWEKYNTGVLYLPWGYDVTQLVAFIVYIITAICGQGIWKFTFPYVNLTPAEAFEGTLYAGAVFLTIPAILRNVWRAYKGGTLKHNSLSEAMRPLSTITILCAATTMWAVYSPSSILFNHIRLFIWLTGVVAANVTCSLIISQMSLTKAKWLHWMLMPVVLVCLAVLAIPALAKQETLLLYVLSVFVTLAHVHYGMSTVKQMANYLNIYPFSIEKPPSIAMSKERLFNGNAGEKSETANELK